MSGLPTFFTLKCTASGANKNPKLHSHSTRRVADNVETDHVMTTVLVVDDDIPILDLLTEMLEECGYQTLRACNGREAYEVACKARPHIIITDIMMPVMDGYELLKAVRNTPHLRRTRVILASAGISNLRAINDPIGADGYIQKPFSLNEVEQTLLPRTFTKRAEPQVLQERAA